MRVLRIVPWLVLALLGFVAPVRGDLASYVARPEPEYRWTKESVTPAGVVEITDVNLRSQVWRGIPWDHKLRVFRPLAVKYPRLGVLVVTGGNPGTDDTQIGTLAAMAIGAPVAILFNIPNQPLFDGKTEDELIAHTFSEYLKSGDDTWPLLLPMTKSAVKAMDALQALSEQEWKARIEGFVVTGASKRGWTTWLTGAVDPRVRGIAPMVFDNLNFAAQMPHQLKLWGKYSEQIEAYSRRDLQAQGDTERGKQLTRMVDPWFYRDRLTMPKLLVNGSNDRYWATDATTLYWDDLKGDNRLLVMPNAGHALDGDRLRMFGTIAAFCRNVAEGKKLPALTSRAELKDGQERIRVTVDSPAKEVRLWVATSATHDFREAKWEARPMRLEGDAYLAELPVPATGAVAWFAEAEFAGEMGSYMLSTTPRVAPAP
jgi:PhoPQ-activated pathogenicity-related protein